MKSSHTLIIILILFLLGSLSGCNSRSTITTVSNTPIPTMTRTVQWTSTLQRVTSTPTPTALPPGCSDIYPDPQIGQAGYNGIYPGITSRDELLETMGEPDRSYSEYYLHWTYLITDEDSVGFAIENQTVVQITVTFYDVAFTTLEDVVSEYGCPTLILALDNSEDPEGHYIRSFLAYPMNGILIYFSKFPLTLSDTYNVIYFFKPVTLHELLANQVTWNNPDIGRQVTWEELIGQ